MLTTLPLFRIRDRRVARASLATIFPSPVRHAGYRELIPAHR
jgi:hypothetical protein